MSKRALRRVIRAKAEFLVNTEFDFASVARALAHKRYLADQMPTRGHRQRDKKRQALDEIDATMERYLSRLGARVWETWRFVDQNQERLAPTLRRKLRLEERV